jgi:glycosyltransferase involved in cell wall biosynthesis
MKPRVALDCRLVSWPGINRYVCELAEVLATEADDLDFRWVCLPGDQNRWPRRPGAEAIVAPFAPLTVGEQLRWPGWIARQGLALWHAPVAHHVPWFGATPLVATMHDLILQRMPHLSPSIAGRLYYGVANAVTLRRAHTVICISQATHDDTVRAWPAARSRLRIVRHGIAERFRHAPVTLPRPAALAALQVQDGYLLYVGTCKPHKNLARLLQAYASLSLELRNRFPLVMVVKLRDRNPETDSVAAELGLQPWLRWIEGVSDDELKALYTYARAVVLVSLIEGWGAPVSEAMGCGTPSVVTAGSAQAEVAGASGLPCDALNPSDIARALHTMLADDGLNACLSAAARDRALQFDWRHTARATAQAYRDALSQGLAAAR